MFFGKERDETIEGVKFVHERQPTAVIAMNMSPAILPKHSEESQRRHRSSLSRKLSLIFLSLTLKEEL